MVPLSHTSPADLVVNFKAIALPIEPRTSLNVGMISGGTSVNTIAPEANLLLDLRSVSPTVLDNVSNQVEELVQLAERRGGEAVKVKAEVIGSRPPGEIPSDHPLVKLAIACSAAHGVKSAVIGSTDQ
jgi:acetylornithine deacetylase/succinyl-diaminopimelate desuccinylase-like protein